VSEVKEEKCGVKREEQKVGSIPLHALMMFVQYLEGDGVGRNMKCTSPRNGTGNCLNANCKSISSILKYEICGVCNSILSALRNIL
jgi:hypothetical protein